MMLRGIHSLLAHILMLEDSNLPPTTDSIMHHSRRGEGVSFVKDTGHFARACPLNNGNNQSFRYGSAPNAGTGNEGHAGQNRAPPTNTFVASGLGSTLKDEYAYIDIVVEGKRHLALIDTGCQVSLIPSSLVGDRPLLPSNQKLFAANRSPIHVLETVELPVTIAGHNAVVKMLVTPDVREPMLSFAWLSENQVCWDFTRNALYMHGRFIPLKRKKSLGL